MLPVITFLHKSELYPTIMEQGLSTNPSGLYGESPCYNLNLSIINLDGQYIRKKLNHFASLATRNLIEKPDIM